MKNTILIASTLFFSFLALNPLNAQWGVGGGLAFGSDVEDLGVQLRGIYSINEQWRAAADFIFYLDGEDGVSLFEFNVNGHYIFNETDNMLFYGLAGLNAFSIKLDSFGEDFKTTEIGLNIGGGGQYYFNDQLSGLVELKYAISDINQLVVAFGVIYGF